MGEFPVPLHLRNAPTSLMRDLGYGKNYKYSHDYENHFVEQDYLPEPLKEQLYYLPTDEGREKQLSEFLKKRWKKRRS